MITDLARAVALAVLRLAGHVWVTTSRTASFDGAEIKPIHLDFTMLAQRVNPTPLVVRTLSQKPSHCPIRAAFEESWMLWLRSGIAAQTEGENCGRG